MADLERKKILEYGKASLVGAGIPSLLLTVFLFTTFARIAMYVPRHWPRGTVGSTHSGRRPLVNRKQIGDLLHGAFCKVNPILAASSAGLGSPRIQGRSYRQVPQPVRLSTAALGIISPRSPPLV